MNPEVQSRIPLLNSPDQIPLETKLLHEEPAIVHIKNLLTPEECQHIINVARPKLASSTLIVNNREVTNSARTSRSAFITESGLPSNDPIIQKFLTQCQMISGFSLPHFEGMKVVHYQYGQEYQAHHDYFREHTNFRQKAGDRICTFFVYLNSLHSKQGGSTSFPKLNLKVNPQQGDAVFWTNMDFQGNYYEDTLHSGDPILDTATEKWGINIWIRERTYR